MQKETPPSEANCNSQVPFSTKLLMPEPDSEVPQLSQKSLLGLHDFTCFFLGKVLHRRFHQTMSVPSGFQFSASLAVRSIGFTMFYLNSFVVLDFMEYLQVWMENLWSSVQISRVHSKCLFINKPWWVLRLWWEWKIICWSCLGSSPGQWFHCWLYTNWNEIGWNEWRADGWSWWPNNLKGILSAKVSSSLKSSTSVYQVCQVSE